MSMPVGRPPTVDDHLDNHLLRIRALEANPDIEPLAPPLPVFAIDLTLPDPVPSGTDFAVDLSGGAIKTNDGGFVWDVTAPTSPFTGDFFAFDWGGDAFDVNIVAAGIYLVRSYFRIDTVATVWPATTYSVFSMRVSCGPGLNGLANDSPTQSELVSPGSYAFTELKAAQERHEVIPSSLLPQPFGLVVRHDGVEGDATSSFAGMSIVRLGSLT